MSELGFSTNIEQLNNDAALIIVKEGNITYGLKFFNV